jgi:hypothetical protein
MPHMLSSFLSNSTWGKRWNEDVGMILSRIAYPEDMTCMQSYCTKFSDTSESFYKKFDGYGCNLEFKECVLFYNIL